MTDPENPPQSPAGSSGPGPIPIPAQARNNILLKILKKNEIFYQKKTAIFC